MKAQDIMTKNPRTVTPETDVREAAQIMKSENVGVVPVVESSGSKKLVGLLTDRDIAVRVVANDLDPKKTQVKQVASENLVTLSPNDSTDAAVKAMRDNGLRRMPVVEDSRIIGIVSLGDLAQAMDPKSALGGISSARPNL